MSKLKNTKYVYLIDENIEEDFYLRSLNHQPFYQYSLGVLKGNLDGLFIPSSYNKLSEALESVCEVTAYDQNVESLLSMERDDSNLLILNGSFPFVSQELFEDFISTCSEQANLHWSTVIEIDEQILDAPMLNYYPKYGNESIEEDGLFQIEYLESMTPSNKLPWEVFETIARTRIQFDPAKEHQVKLLILDADGVLNDAGFYYGPDGEVMKKYNTRDGAGIKQIQSLGVEVGIITGEKSGFTPARAAKLGIDRIETGCSNKLPVLEKWKTELGLEWENIAYMGDDLPDIPCLEKAGMAGCPANAEPEVRAVSKFIASLDGGHGCVREFIRYMIYEKFITDSN